jgi:hypothetical protein
MACAPLRVIDYDPDERPAPRTSLVGSDDFRRAGTTNLP